MTPLVLEHVSKSFGERKVLEDVSLSFPEGITCVMGPSGLGKTTLLRVIAGLLPPDAGRITGRPDRVAFVFQEDRLCEDFSAVANVRLVTGKDVPEEEILRTLDALGLSGSERMKVRELSGGMKRRAAIARALLYRPQLLLLDEAFKGLDEERREKTMDCIRNESAGRIVICVTHDPEEADYLGGRVIRLKGGEHDDRNETGSP